MGLSRRRHPNTLVVASGFSDGIPGASYLPCSFIDMALNACQSVGITVAFHEFKTRFRSSDPQSMKSNC